MPLSAVFRHGASFKVIFSFPAPVDRELSSRGVNGSVDPRALLLSRIGEGDGSAAGGGKGGLVSFFT